MQQASSFSTLGAPVKIEDPRSPLQHARRRQLREFCRQESIPFDLTDPATLLRKKIIEAGHSHLAINEKGETPPDPQITEPVPDALDEGISKLSWGELKGKCKQIGIPLHNKQKRPDLEGLLKEALCGHAA